MRVACKGGRQADMQQEIIRLGSAHRDRAVETLALAFHNDPAMVHMLPEEANRGPRLRRLMGWMVDQQLRMLKLSRVIDRGIEFERCIFTLVPGAVETPR